MNENHQQTVTVSTFTDFLEKTKASQNTVKAYAADLACLLRHFGLDPESPDPRALEALQSAELRSYLTDLADKGFKFGTIKRNLAALKGFFGFLVKQGMIKSDPTKPLYVRPPVKGAFTTSQVLSLFEHLSRRQKMGNEVDIIRTRRNEAILLLMILCGVRQYQLAKLKLSDLRTSDSRISLNIRRNLSIPLDAIVLQKLRSYLSIRKSNFEAILQNVEEHKPVRYSDIQVLMIQCSCVLRTECSPKALTKTYVWLRQNPEERRRLIERISTLDSQSSQGNSGND